MESIFPTSGMVIAYTLAGILGLCVLTFVILLIRRIRLKKHIKVNEEMPKLYGGLMACCVLCALFCFWMLW